MPMTHDLGTRIEIAQHGRPARLNRLVNRNRATGEIVTPPSYKKLIVMAHFVIRTHFIRTARLKLT